MHVVLQTIGAIVALPYIALAAGFLLIGDVARAKGLVGIFDVVLHHFDWIVRWGIYGFLLLWIVFLIMGFFDQFQRFTALCLFLLATGSSIVIMLLHSSRMEFGHYLFLAPCFAVAATSAWLFIRAAGSV